jgi:hypothetical protein
MTRENSAEAGLSEKVCKIEALFAGAGTAGEKAAAGAAADRIRAILGNVSGSEAPEEIKFSSQIFGLESSLSRFVVGTGSGPFDIAGCTCKQSSSKRHVALSMGFSGPNSKN